MRVLYYLARTISSTSSYSRVVIVIVIIILLLMANKVPIIHPFIIANNATSLTIHRIWDLYL